MSKRGFLIVSAVFALGVLGIVLVRPGEPERATQTEAVRGQVRFDAGIGSDGDDILVAGGATASIADIADEASVSFSATNELTRYDATGSVIGRTALEVPTGRVLFAPSVATAGDRVFVAGGLCAVPSTAVGGCSSAATPALFVVQGERAAAVDTASIAVDGARPGDGRLILLGASAGSVYLQQVVGAGPHPGTVQPRLLQYSDGAGLRELPAPNGVFTERSFCASEAGLVAITPQLGAGLRITALDILFNAAGSTGVWQKTGSLQVNPPMSSSAGGVVCDAASAMAWIEADTSRVWRFTAAAPRADETQPTLVDGHATGVVSAGRFLVTARNGVEAVTYWDFAGRAGRRLGVRQLPPEAQGQPTFAVAVSSGVYDVGELLTAVPAAGAKRPARVSD